MGTGIVADDQFVEVRKSANFWNKLVIFLLLNGRLVGVFFHDHRLLVTAPVTFPMMGTPKTISRGAHFQVRLSWGVCRECFQFLQVEGL